jgi:type IV pilus secretin PilQ/predicted competence protein
VSATLLVSLLLTLLFTGVAHAYYCIQLLTTQDGGQAVTAYNAVSDLPAVRLEKIGAVFVVQVGSASQPAALQELLTHIQTRLPDTFPMAQVSACAASPAPPESVPSASPALLPPPVQPQAQIQAGSAARAISPGNKKDNAPVPTRAVTTLPVTKGPRPGPVDNGASQSDRRNPRVAPETVEDRITLNIKDVDITEVLKFLSLKRRINVIAGKDVSGPVSVNLYDVPFTMALQAILRSNGFTYHQQDNIIFVTRISDSPDRASRPLPPTMQTFRLNYANIPETAEMVQNLLSPSGKMVIGKESKTLLVTDTSETVEKVAQLLKSLDNKPRQVLIEAKILEVTLDRSSTLGINWDVLFGRNGLGGRLGNVLTQGFATSPAAGAPGLFFSVIDTDFSVMLSALQERGDVNTLANPKVLTLDGKEAEILIGAKLGFRVTTTTQTATLESIQFLNVGTRLLIRPSISNDGYILMHVHPKVSDGVIQAGLPSETTTEATTSVLVKDGTTIIIGGLIREREEELINQVPGLGSLPVIGAFFRSRKETKKKTEIAVLITPYIVPETSSTVVQTTDASPARPVGKMWDDDFVMALSKSL